MRRSRGFTLVEILIALVIMMLVTSALYRTLNVTQRLSRAQTEQVEMQSNVRTGSLIVPNELRELNTWSLGTNDRNDILVAQPDRVQYRAMRGLFTLCESPAAPAVNTQLKVWGNNSLSAYLTPTAGRHGLYVFIEGSIEKDEDDVWLQVPVINNVNTGNSCPGPAASITLILPPIAGLGGLAVGTPVRLYEVMEMKLYVSPTDGRSYLAAQSISGADPLPLPVVGPLLDNNGLDLKYYGANGAETADLREIKSIQVTLRGLTDEAVRVNGSGAFGHPQETLVSRVLLRNSIRP